MQRLRLLSAFLLVTAGSAWAQEPARIVGRVTSTDTGQPIAGANVVVVGTAFGALTDAEGRYAIAGVPAGTHEVRASLIGYADASQSVTAAAGQVVTVDFRLEPRALVLEEIIAVGYGTQQRRTVTGAISSVSGQRLLEVPTADPVKAMQGRVAGVEIVSANNLPGAPINIRIRGVRSITASNEPLYVVDGVPLAGGIGDFNPSNIQSIEILKDAAATAIYGSRGANGVVLITTKTGAAGGLSTEFTADIYAGTARPIKLVDMMNMQQYTEMLQAAARYIGAPDDVNSVLSNDAMRQAYATGTETDWQRAILRTGQTRNARLSLRGSTDRTRFHVSGTFFDQDGLAVGQEYWQGAGTLAIDHTMGRLRLGITANVSRSVRDEGAGDGLWGSALAQTGFGSPYDENGALVPRPDGEANALNPLRTQKFFVHQITRNRIFASAFLDLQLFQGVNWRVNFGPDYTTQDDGQFLGPNAIYPANEDARARLQSSRNFGYTLDNVLQLNRAFGDAHLINATLLYSIQQQRDIQSGGEAEQLPYNEQLWYALSTGQNQRVNSNLSEWALQSYMARVNYTLFDRYTISGAVRWDGSSRLAEGRKWSTFPSVGAAWQLGREPFLRDVGFLSFLKLRGSYGAVGNTAIAPNQTQGVLTRTVYNFGSANGFGYGPDAGNPPNPFLTWEKTYKTDIGVDFGLFNERITGTIDWYRDHTQDLLLRRTLPVTSGFQSVLQNVGETRNQGIEISLSTVNLTGENGGPRWTSELTWTTNDNKIVALVAGDTAGCPANARPCDLNNGWFVGQPVNINNDRQRRVWFDYKFEGIWQLGQEEEAASYGSEFKPGEIRVADINGDHRITAADRMILGNTYAKWTGSLYNRLDWRGFELSALATAKWGYTMFDELGNGANSLMGRFGNLVTEYWTPERPSNKAPAPRLNGNTPRYNSSRFYRDGSHWRIRNITVAYTLPQSWASRYGVRAARIYATAQEPFVFTDYYGYDPENGTNAGAPAYRTLLVGAQFTW